MQEEERQDCLEATVHEHLHSYVKKTTGINADLTLLGERSNHHCDKLNSLKRGRKRQEAFNCCMEAKMLDLEGMIEGQADRIAELEDEVAILRSKRECKCGELTGSALTGGKGSITQWVHGEFIVISEAICSHFTHQAHGKHF